MESRKKRKRGRPKTGRTPARAVKIADDVYDVAKRRAELARRSVKAQVEYAILREAEG